MRSVIMSLIVFGAGLFGGVLSGPMGGIPTQQEQADVLGNVQEVFDQIKRMVDEEGRTTDKSVVEDTRRSVKRAQDALSLIEEMALIKVTCLSTENSVQLASATNEQIQRTIQEGHEKLDECTEKVSHEIQASSERVFDVASATINRGQTLLDSMTECTTKSALHQISCYRKIMRTEVFPFKEMLLTAIDSHKAGHSRSTDIRNKANDCVDEVLDIYQSKVATILSKAIQ